MKIMSDMCSLMDECYLDPFNLKVVAPLRKVKKPSIFCRQEMGIWLSNRPLLEVLSLDHFPELVSIHELPALAKSKRLTISKCPKLKQRR